MKIKVYKLEDGSFFVQTDGHKLADKTNAKNVTDKIDHELITKALLTKRLECKSSTKLTTYDLNQDFANAIDNNLGLSGEIGTYRIWMYTNKSYFFIETSDCTVNALGLETYAAEDVTHLISSELAKEAIDEKLITLEYNLYGNKKLDEIFKDAIKDEKIRRKEEQEMLDWNKKDKYEIYEAIYQ